MAASTAGSAGGCSAAARGGNADLAVRLNGSSDDPDRIESGLANREGGGGGGGGHAFRARGSPRDGAAKEVPSHLDPTSPDYIGPHLGPAAQLLLKGGATKKHNPFVRMLLKLTRKEEEEKKNEGLTIDMLQPCRYKPNDLDQMAAETKFSKMEVRRLYRAFKQDCPTGIVDEDTFKEVYDKIFPLGDASHYAHLVFLSIDKDRTGGITFGDFMEFLSVITKGTTEDKLQWAFTFYDVNHDGVISREELIKVTDSIYELMGNGFTTPLTGAAAVGSAAAAAAAAATAASGRASKDERHAHVDRVFQTMDLNHDGEITVDEFVHYCRSHQGIKESMTSVMPPFW